MPDSDAAICNMALLRIGQNTDLLGALDDPGDTAAACALVYAQKRDAALRSFNWKWAQRRGFLEQLGGATYATGTTYAQGDYASFEPTDPVNAPEGVTTFVYLSLQANNTGHAPDTSPTFWRQISRAGWSYAFLLPDDCLTIQGLYHGVRNERSDERVPYEEGYEPSPGPGRILFTDAGLPYEMLGDQTTPVSVELEYIAQVTDVHQFPSDFVEALAWDIATELALGLRKDPDAATRCAAAAEKAWGRARARALQETPREQPPVPSHIAARFTGGWPRR